MVLHENLKKGDQLINYRNLFEKSNVSDRGNDNVFTNMCDKVPPPSASLIKKQSTVRSITYW